MTSINVYIIYFACTKVPAKNKTKKNSLPKIIITIINTYTYFHISARKGKKKKKNVETEDKKTCQKHKLNRTI